MKEKIKRIFITFFAVSIIISAASIANSTDKQSKLTEEEIENIVEQISYDFPTKFNTNLYKNCVVCDKNTNKCKLDYANRYWNKIPAKIRKEFVENGWKIILTDKDLSEEFFDGTEEKLCGVALYEIKTIYIENRDSAIKHGLVHEVGHVYDYLYLFPSQNEEFERIYNTEKDKFVEYGVEESTSTDDISEYFAEAFAQSIMYPESCKKNQPKTYEYVIGFN